MKNMLSILILFMVLSSCSEQTPKNNTSGSKQEIEPVVVEAKKTEPPKCDSLYTSYYDNGNKKEEGCVVNGEKEGVWKSWTYFDPYLTASTLFYTKGNLRLQVDTMWRTNRNNIASIDSIMYIKEDSIVSKEIFYHKNGSLERTSGSINGRPHGFTKIWDENGSLMSESLSNNGTCVSYKKYNSENGILVREETFHGSCLTKTEKEYDRETGKLIAVREYKDDKLVSEKKY